MTAESVRRNPDKQVVFMGIGFETTAPMTAHVLKTAPENFSVLCSHRLVPPAMELLLKGGYDIDGFIDPGHVSTIIGISPYEKICEEFHTPQVIAGFEPLDVLMSIFMILEQLKNITAKVENEYWRVVKPEASLKLRPEFSEYDAEKRFDLTPEGEGCGTDCPLCGSILKGISNPQDCELFDKSCTSENPVGACMVSSEGTCNIAYRYGLNLF
jgi:hydrogenase expression/formation protein HypD